MTSNLTINYNRNYNCKLLTMNAILSRVLPSSQLLWSQAGLVTYENDDYLYLTPNYLDDFGYLKKVANIDTIENKQDNMVNFLTDLNARLEKGYTVMICVDVFDLPFNMYYKQQNSNHYIEVVGMEDNKLLICDHFYKYTGAVDSVVIEQAMRRRMNIDSKGYYSFIYFNVENHCFKIDIQYLLNVMAINNSIILGKEEMKLYEMTGYKRTIGLKTFEIFNKFLINQLNPNGPLQRIYRDLFNLSNSRYHYSDVLYAFKDEYPELDKIVNIYRDIAQSYRIASNLVLKLRASKKDDSYYTNISKILDSVLCKEKEASYQIDNFLKSKSQDVENY
ncbi:MULTISPECIES: BtrH N-terminal domain-containing protein [Bacillus cereus group]|uniref:BtrH N-terminal domain-containing protein n=1 Tax=Bacillus cereus group TaxID=86661 RepID=UPI0002EE4847|nr:MULTISPECIES: BtrH N-terminal domain-containing protein [Bacillus cereus group]MEB9627260.1 BtrH N-terminal domain-containing protein [Bacillus anthracis]OUA98281.1 hypothetical protein BK714_13025 [Bacillus thuringiensis serovar oswaldocruzi]